MKRKRPLRASSASPGSPGSDERIVRDALRRLTRERFVQRLWAHDPTLWKRGPERRSIEQRLGWLGLPELMAGRVKEITQCVDSVRKSGMTHVVLLGMGGSSLCAEVWRRTFGIKKGFPELIVLDTTDPATIAGVTRRINPRKTVVIVSSKSGTTIEVEALSRHFFHHMQSVVTGPVGAHFIAITDPDTVLAKRAREEGYRHLFLNPPDVGGRYSALSYFGLVPAALIGVNLRRLLERARAMARRCRLSPERNPGVRLGALLGGLAMAGRDKMTLVSSAALRSFGMWAEQLVAESTGKEGRGIVPVDGELPLGEPDRYGDDRLFIRLARSSDAKREAAEERRLEAIRRAGRPVARLMLRDALDLGAEMFRWEIATAAAGALLKINPFDEPNVTESKEQTRSILKSGRGGNSFLVAQTDELVLTTPRPWWQAPLADALRTFLSEGDARDYVAILAYLPQTERHDALLQTIRLALRDRLRLATTVGYGPRYLHSTGQLHKGGPARGRFLLLTADEQEELPILGWPYGFGALKHAQAFGDLAALAQHGRRIVHLHLRADVTPALERLARLLTG